jgi:hypothetical protein
MVWSQYPISLSSAREWHDVANLHRRCIDHNAIYEQFYNSAPGRERRLLQVAGYGRTEGLQVCGKGGDLLASHLEGLELLRLPMQGGQAIFQRFAPWSELVKCQ